MSDNKAINKDEREALQEIEKICGGAFRRVAETGYHNVENLFDFNKEGSIMRLGLDLYNMDLDDQKINLIGAYVAKFTNLEILFINSPKDKDIPEWIKNLTSIKILTIPNTGLKQVPEGIKEYRNLEKLYLSRNKISQLPEWFRDFNNLKQFNLRDWHSSLELNQSNIDVLKYFHQRNVKVDNDLYSLHVKLAVPLDQVRVIKDIFNEDEENAVEVDEIESIDKPLNNFYSYRVNPRVLNGKIVHLAIWRYKLKHLPEDFGKLGDIVKLDLSLNQLESIPESIGNLTRLKELNLSQNQLTNLPDSFFNLTSMTKLDLSNNKFTEIPTQLWALKDLTELNLNGNPLNPENLNLSKKTPDIITETLRKQATIKIFISHAVVDFEPYRIEELVNYLEKQKEISQVLFCEEDMSGSIDQWMLDNVQKCQLVLFIGTNKSVFNSVDCANELQLADKFSIPVVPLKGMDIDWQDLAEKNLSRQLGLEYDLDNFGEFCANVYKYIENLKREINLMEKEARVAGITDIYERFRLMLDEKLSEVLHKMDQIVVKMDSFTDRLDKLENK
ncbi:MAG: hypothetical protein JW891_07225 [Candidatus Lokiarchaeota archaeon]|nr:hypothetical protein [Candidatus Lokiarchaeota archaeon]